MNERITVKQLCNLYLHGEKTVRIWSCFSYETVFKGSFWEATESEYSDFEVLSFGIENGTICINI